MRNLTVVSQALAFVGMFAFQAAAQVEFVVHISVDGLRPDAVTALGPERAPNFYRLRSEGAFTDNARTDVDYTNTLPNHAGMLTGRRVKGTDGHSVTFNDTHAGTFASVHGSYVAGVFDVAHDRGLRTALFYSKDKFDFFARSWDAGHGAPDTVGTDEGTAKIDRALFRDKTASLTNKWIDDMRAAPYNYSFIHFRDPDTFGHARVWMSRQYLDAVETVDGYLGQIFDLIETDSTLVGKTAIVLTTDHGGSGTNHVAIDDPRNFVIPQYVWGPGIDAAADVYELNWVSRRPLCGVQPVHGADPPPVRNSGTGNLSLSLLGLPPIPGSTINNSQNLAWSLSEGTTLPDVAFSSPASDASFVPGEPIPFEVGASAEGEAIDRVVFQLGCDTLGTDAAEPFTLEWSSAPPGTHLVRATAFDAAGRFRSDTLTVSVAGGLTVNGSDLDWLALTFEPVLDTDSLQSDDEVALDRLYFHEDSATVYFAFDAGAQNKRVAYGLYVDVDATQAEQSSDPLGHAVRSSKRHAPEFVFYFVHDPAEGWNDNSPSFYQLDRESGDWMAGGWPTTFQFAADTGTGFVEFAFPKEIVTGYEGSQGILAQLFSVGESPGVGASESVPSDTGVAFTEENTSTDITVLSEFYSFSFPKFGGESITIDGNRSDWGRVVIEPVVNNSEIQTDPDLISSGLFITHDLDSYYFAFPTVPGSKQVSFGLYIDSGDFTSDGLGVGGSTSANGSAVETSSSFLPDVQIFFDNDTSGVWVEDTPRYYMWDEAAGAWGTLSDDGPTMPAGSAFATGLRRDISWVEFSIPRDAPGLYDSELLAVELFSVGGATGAGASFTIPADPGVQFTEENTSTDVTVLVAPYTYSTNPVIVNREADQPEVVPASANPFYSYPNPASGSATMRFSVERRTRARVVVYDLLGRLAAVLLDREIAPGDQQIHLDLSNLAGGTYIVRLESDGHVATRKLVVAR
jgi:hypothetical protein